MFSTEKILDFLKLKLSVLVAISIALAAFLFLPDNAARLFGIDALRLQYRSYAGCAFLVTVSLVVVQLFGKAWGCIRERSEVQKLRLELIERLSNLSPAEKQILCGYILPQKRTQNLSIRDGNVTGLCAAGILCRASNFGSIYGKGFAFNIQDWAWDYLNANQTLITEGVQKDTQGRIILYRNPDDLGLGI